MEEDLSSQNPEILHKLSELEKIRAESAAREAAVLALAEQRASEAKTVEQEAQTERMRLAALEQEKETKLKELSEKLEAAQASKQSMSASEMHCSAIVHIHV